MLLYSWNVNGIRAVLKKGALQSFLKEHKPDILCIQETKAQKEQVEFDSGDYLEYWHSAEKKGYSGTAILSKIEPLSVVHGLPSKITSKYELEDQYGDSSKEGRVLTLEFENYYVSTVYTPNAKDKLLRIKNRQEWDKAYLEFINSLESKKPVLFCGDLNVARTEEDLARPQENEGKKGFSQQERDGIEKYFDVGFVDSFRQFHEGNGHYTWWTAWGGARERNVGWRIDYWLVSPKLSNKIRKASIHADVMGSDHCPVSIEMDI